MEKKQWKSEFCAIQSDKNVCISNRFIVVTDFIKAFSSLKIHLGVFLLSVEQTLSILDWL